MPVVLIATEKPFAAAAVTGIESALSAASVEVRKLEKYADKGELLAAVADVDAMIVRSDKIDAEVLDAAKNLKLVVRAGAGVDTIDLKGALDRNVVVMNTPGQNSNAVAELAFGMMITKARNNYDGSSGTELMGKKLGLYGYGAVARCMHRLATGFGMQVKALDVYAKQAILDAGIPAVDNVADLFDCEYVSLHIPLTPETGKSITKELFMKLPKNGAVLNTARPEVIDEEGMLAALTERADLSYIADVKPTNLEALPAKQVLVTAKKMGAQTAEANNNAGVAAANQIVSYFQTGDVKFQVNKPGQNF